MLFKMNKVYDIAIIGAGAAGMTAGIYGSRAGKSALVIERKTYGGQILNTTRIENYPAMAHVSGSDFAKNLYNQAKELGVEFRFNEVVEVQPNLKNFKLTTDEDEILAKTIIFANGSTERKLGLPKEDELVGKGISYCATCDGSLFKDKVVAINGGGNTALWSALYLSNLAKKVYLIHRRDEFRADKALVKKVSVLKNVDFIMSSKITEIIGDKKLEGLVLDNGQKIEVEGLFVTIGRVPENKRFENLIKLDTDGYIVTDENCSTSREGVFAAGDTRKKKLNQLVTATADGAIAATEAIDYLNR